VPRHFGYDPRPHRGDRFPIKRSHTHFESRYLDGTPFPRRGSCPTGSSGEVLKTMKTFFCRMVECRIPKIYLTNLSLCRW
jgi:hypothetical protein